MRAEAPFQPADLRDLDGLLSRASMVVPMREIAYGERIDASSFAGPLELRGGPHPPDVIGLRHDVDNVIAPAVAMAEWEAARGYRSTYFILHTAPYWREKETLRAALEVIAECGHEIGFHVNAITEAIETGRDPVEIVEDAVGELRGYGYDVSGVVAHGDASCYRHNFVNDEMFLESPRPGYGNARRLVGGVQLEPVSRAYFGFTYDPNWLSRAEYLSDSGGRWSRPFDEVAAGFPYAGQLHMLVHADWWSEAFVPAELAA